MFEREFNINPYEAMRIMVEDGGALEGRSLKFRDEVMGYRWSGPHESFQVRVGDKRWESMMVSKLLFRMFRLPEQRVWEFETVTRRLISSHGTIRTMVEIPSELSESTRVKVRVELI